MVRGTLCEGKWCREGRSVYEELESMKGMRQGDDEGCILSFLDWWFSQFLYVLDFLHINGLTIGKDGNFEKQLRKISRTTTRSKR